MQNTFYDKIFSHSCWRWFTQIRYSDTSVAKDDLQLYNMMAPQLLKIIYTNMIWWHLREGFPSSASQEATIGSSSTERSQKVDLTWWVIGTELSKREHHRTITGTLQEHHSTMQDHHRTCGVIGTDASIRDHYRTSKSSCKRSIYSRERGVRAQDGTMECKSSGKHHIFLVLLQICFF